MDHATDEEGNVNANQEAKGAIPRRVEEVDDRGRDRREELGEQI